MAEEDFRHLVRRAFEADSVRPSVDWIESVGATARNSSASRGSAAMAIVATVVLCVSVASAAGLTLALHAHKGNAPATSNTGLFTVTATLLSVKGGPVYACRILEWSLPPAGCTGVEVQGVDIRSVEGVQYYGQGTLVTPTLKLVGRWEPPVLVSTQAPIPSSLSTQPHILSAGRPQSFSPGMPSDADAVAQRLKGDLAFLRGQGILVDGFGWDGTNLDVVLIEGDRSTAQYLTGRYGRIKIEAWLEPI